MNQGINRQVRLRSRPSAIPQAEHFEIVEVPLPELGPGQVLVRNIYLSVEPAMRGWVNAVGNYSARGLNATCWSNAHACRAL